MKIRDLFEKYSKDQVKIVLAYLLDMNFSQVISSGDKEITPELEKRINEIFEKINSGLPIQYALGVWDFYGRTFKVTPDALIPRPETEMLVEKILDSGIEVKNILDIGTGTGAIAISLALEGNAEIWASDISQDALDLAKDNAFNLSADVNFILSDLFTNIEGKFDIIVSNPPYISQKDYDNLDKELYYEPKNALLGGEKGYEIYERIIENAPDFLNDRGSIYFEIGYDQGKIVKELLEKNEFKDVQVIKDYGGKDRLVIGHLNL